MPGPKMTKIHKDSRGLEIHFDPAPWHHDCLNRACVCGASNSLWSLSCRVLLGSISIALLCSCSQMIDSLPQFSSKTNEQPEEVEPTISSAEYVQGLRKAKTLLLDLPVLTAAELEVDSVSSYRTFIQSYLDDNRSTKRIIQFYQQLLQLEGSRTVTNFENTSFNIVIDDDEPASLAGYLYQNEMDFREILTADYCVNKIENGLTLKSDCVSRGRRVLNSDNLINPAFYGRTTVPMEMRAGAISTQAFLARFSGALNFRRPAAAREYFLCRNYPDAEENEGWTEANGQLHPFYYTPDGGDQDCQSCHQTLNKVRGFFTGFGPLGEIQMGQTAARLDTGQDSPVTPRTINTVEAATLSLPDYQNLYGKSSTMAFEEVLSSYHGQEITSYDINLALATNPLYPKLADYGRILSESPAFAECTAQRFYNLAMGINQNINNRLPDRIRQHLINQLENNNFNLKVLLIEILSSTDFLDQ